MFGQPEPYLISFNDEDLYPHFDDDYDYDSQQLSTDPTLLANDYDAYNGTDLPDIMISPGSTSRSTTWTATEISSPTSTWLSSINDESPGPRSPVTMAEQEIPSAIGHGSNEEEEVRCRLPTRRMIAGPIQGELDSETLQQGLVDWPPAEGACIYHWTNKTHNTIPNFTTQVEESEPKNAQTTTHRYFPMSPTLRRPQEPIALPFGYVLLEPSTNQDSDPEQEPLSTQYVQPPDVEALVLESWHGSMKRVTRLEEELDGPRKRRRTRKLAGDPVLEQKPEFTKCKDIKPRFYEVPAIPIKVQRKKSVARLEEKRDGLRKRKRTKTSVQDASTPFENVVKLHDAAPSPVRQSMDTVIRKEEEERDEQEMRSQRSIQICERCREGQLECDVVGDSKFQLACTKCMVNNVECILIHGP